jgi:hypothetical protein
MLQNGREWLSDADPCSDPTYKLLKARGGQGEMGIKWKTEFKGERDAGKVSLPDQVDGTKRQIWGQDPSIDLSRPWPRDSRRPREGVLASNLR